MRTIALILQRDWIPIASRLFLIASIFFVPISSTGKSIAISLAVVLIAATPNFWNELKLQLSKTWCKAALLLFLLAVIGCFWGSANIHEKIAGLGKYTKLLLLPILTIGFADARSRSLGIKAFLLAMTITCLISFIMFNGLLNYHDGHQGMVFRNYIMTGFMMSFAAYLSVLLAIRTHGKERILYGGLTLLFSFQVLFINFGRTGYVIYVLMMALLIIQLLNWRQALAALLLGGCLLPVIYMASPIMKSGIKRAIVEYQQDNQDNPVGYRLQFHDYAQTLFKRHPLVGNGTAGFTSSYRIEKPVSSWTRRLLEPHSNYWLIASEYGLFGIVIFIFFFTSLLVESFKMQSMRVVAVALIIPFMLGNLSDSLLYYSGTGYFFVLFMALCLGERRNIDIPTT